MQKPSFATRSRQLSIDAVALRAFLRHVGSNFTRLSAFALSAFFVVIGLDLLLRLDIPLLEQLTGLVGEYADSALALVFVAITLPAVFQTVREG